MEIWTKAAANEYGWLFQGCGRNEDSSQHTKGTDACHWIRRNQVQRRREYHTVERWQISDWKKKIRIGFDSQLEEIFLIAQDQLQQKHHR